MYVLGYDIGSSSIKGAIVDAQSGAIVGSAQSPLHEMVITSPHPGWAEQNPDDWWQHVCAVTRQLLEDTEIDPSAISSIGISYQMHGLVVVDHQQTVLRPAIIWCDSRAVDIGNDHAERLGADYCINNILNSPGNFTASKIKWIKENEPSIYAQIDKMMLPGDYIAMRLCGQVSTTVSGLSEGMLWDFHKDEIAYPVLDAMGIDRGVVPTVYSNFEEHGRVTAKAASETGLTTGIPLSYRSGDQPNNALSLGVLQPGDIAATGGTSGVVYGITDQLISDQKSRINSFAHINHASNHKRIGLLLCINGTGSAYAWMRKITAATSLSYPQMEELASQVSIGSDGLCIIPFGNGSERMLENQDDGAQILNLNFNRHGTEHLYRATLEGIAFSFAYGIEMLKNLGTTATVLKVGNDNLFQSVIFRTTVSTVTGCRIDMIETTGAVGAAKASGFGTGFYTSLDAAINPAHVLVSTAPEEENQMYLQAYETWSAHLESYKSKK